MSKNARRQKPSKEREERSDEPKELWTAPGTIIAAISAVIAAISLALSLIAYVRTIPEDLGPIRAVIDMEARASLIGDLNVVSLYAEDGWVRDARAMPPQIWSGRTELRGRYASLPKFEKLGHVDLSITVAQDGIFAQVIASTVGELLNADGTGKPISSVDGERWELKKIGGTWKIVSFTYNIHD